jgi:glutamate---cysteine ligase / carboxylate-amine ligase
MVPLKSGLDSLQGTAALDGLQGTSALGDLRDAAALDSAPGAAVPRSIPTDSVGVEEEFHVLDPGSGELVEAAPQLLSRFPTVDFGPELQRAMLETATSVHYELSELRADLVARRTAARSAAESMGLALAACGTVPGSGAGRVAVFPDPRYEWMAEEYCQIVAEQQLCATQVHVGLTDRDVAVRVIQRIQEWLPVLLAMSASSPFFQEIDTGYASYRSIAVSRWPTVGLPPEVDTAAEYDRLVNLLVHTGVISDDRMIYFDARLSSRYPTVEIRICDACPMVDDVVLLAALSRALVTVAVAQDCTEPTRVQPPALQRAAMWRAARSGLAGPLVSPVRRVAVPPGEAVAALLGHCREALERRDEWSAVRELTEDLLARGTSAHRQRAAYRAGLSPARVTATVIAETAAT